MIAEHLEPKGLSRDTPALSRSKFQMDGERDDRRGSDMLRDAIRSSLGLDPWPTQPIVREVAHIPKACHFCGAPEKPAGMLIAHIQHTVAAYYGIDPRSMVSAQRGWEIARPRQVAMYLSSSLTGKSLPEIGRRFGNRDHTTVIHAIRAVKARMDTDSEIYLDVEVLRERLGG